jgi:hypothetical protein
LLAFCWIVSDFKKLTVAGSSATYKTERSVEEGEPKPCQKSSYQIKG